MVELGPLPVAGLMAGGALDREPWSCMLWILGPGEILEMTTLTVLRRSGESAGGVACRALGSEMAASQGERGIEGMVKTHPQPAIHLVTGCAGK